MSAHRLDPGSSGLALFGSDMPSDPEKGPGFIHDGIAELEALGLPGDDLERIMPGNARRLPGARG